MPFLSNYMGISPRIVQFSVFVDFIEIVAIPISLLHDILMDPNINPPEELHDSDRLARNTRIC